MKVNVITGATGLLGSHIAERLAARGETVRALIRPTSDAAFLKSLGAELVVGDLSDPDSLRRAVDGTDVVYHCAGRVGDYGRWADFREAVIEATGRLLDACRDAGVGRVLHASSIAVYGHPRERADLFTEEEPLGQNLGLWEHYRRAKIRAEELVRAYPGDYAIIRPSWFYGPRDRNSVPRFFKALKAGWVGIMGRGDNLLNVVYAGDVAEGAILAANHPGARGRAYNLGSEGEITQRQFIDLLTDAVGAPRVTRSYPFAFLYWAGFCGEVLFRLFRVRRAPYITRYTVALVGRSTRFSSERAKKELGWRPQTPAAEGVRRTLEWYQDMLKAGYG